MEKFSTDSSLINGLMTEKQLEMLRKQIAIYVSLSKQLALQLSESQPSKSVFPPLKHRWSAKPKQLEILERAFEQCNGKTPSWPKIEEITCQLAAHGNITQANVSNWFQNKRARVRKQK